MDVSNNSTANGAEVIQWQDTGGANQQWRFELNVDGSYSIVNVNSGKVLDVYNAEQTRATRLIQWERNGGDNQKFVLESIECWCKSPDKTDIKDYEGGIYTNEEVQEVANMIKFIAEDASIKDSNGDLITLDFEKIESIFGSSIELEEIKEDFSKALERTPAVDRCIERKIKNGIGEFLTVSFISTVINYIMDGDYKSAAKKLLKAGVRGNFVAIVAQLTYYLGYCIYTEEGWI